MKNAKVIPVTESSAGLLAAIHEECFPNYWNTSDFTNFFAVQNTFAAITEAPAQPDAPLAMAVWRIQHEQADIITLAVRPSYRRRGLARQLLHYTLEHMKIAGVTSVFLDVESGNQPAISLYEAHGFTYVRRRRLYYRQKDGSYTDALVMTKKLKA
jgi:[ribosomal protein S18]-alanine N-acetyltransferase